ncbi:MAG: MFS transporter [Dehalococcoidia bacterium]
MLRRLLPGVYEGWLVVGASAFTVLLIGASFFYGFGTIFNEVIDEFGWSVAATSLAFSLRSEVGGLAAPFIGTLIDRLGARKVILGGIVISAGGVFIMSLIQELWHFYLAMIVIAFGTSAAGGQVGLAAIASWFETRRAAAMSVMTLGGGLGGLLVVVIAWLVELFGWRDALRLLTVVMLTAGVLAGLQIRTRPDDHHQPMDGRRYYDDLGGEVRPAAKWGIPWRLAARTRAAFFMSLAMIALAFGTTTVVVLQIPYMESQIGVSKAVAGATVTALTVISIVGRLGFGFLADRYSKRMMLAVSTAMVVVGLIVLAVANSLPIALLGIVLFAPGFGGSIPVRPALIADYFGTKYFGTINGLGALVMTTGGALGPWLSGVLVDRTGEYTAAWWLCAAVTALAIPLFLLASPPTVLVAHYREEARLEAERLGTEVGDVGTLVVGH